MRSVAFRVVNQVADWTVRRPFSCLSIYWKIAQINKVENVCSVARRVRVAVADWTVRGPLTFSTRPSECWKIIQIKKFDSVWSTILRVRIQVAGSQYEDPGHFPHSSR